MELPNFEPLDVFNVLAGLASMLGFALTIYVSMTVRQIEKGYQRKLRLGDLQRAIADHRSRLSALLADPDGNASDIRERLSLVKGTLGSLVQVVGSDIAREVKALRREIDDYLGEYGPIRWLMLWRQHLGWTSTDPSRIRDRLALIGEQLNNLQKDDSSKVVR